MEHKNENEIFVIPPDLLEAFGISMAAVAQCSDNTTLDKSESGKINVIECLENTDILEKQLEPINNQSISHDNNPNVNANLISRSDVEMENLSLECNTKISNVQFINNFNKSPAFSNHDTSNSTDFSTVTKSKIKINAPLIESKSMKKQNNDNMKKYTDDIPTSNQTFMAAKTYSRVDLKKSNKNSNVLDKNLLSEKNINEILETETRNQNFCIPNDFGSLSYHNHSSLFNYMFLAQEPDDINSTDIFSIYCENYPRPYFTSECKHNTVNETKSLNCKPNFKCMNDLNLFNSLFNVNVENNTNYENALDKVSDSNTDLVNNILKKKLKELEKLHKVETNVNVVVPRSINCNLENYSDNENSKDDINQVLEKKFSRLKKEKQVKTYMGVSDIKVKKYFSRNNLNDNSAEECTFVSNIKEFNHIPLNKLTAFKKHNETETNMSIALIQSTNPSLKNDINHKNTNENNFDLNGDNVDQVLKKKLTSFIKDNEIKKGHIKDHFCDTTAEKSSSVLTIENINHILENKFTELKNENKGLTNCCLENNSKDRDNDLGSNVVDVNHLLKQKLINLNKQKTLEKNINVSDLTDYYLKSNLNNHISENISLDPNPDENQILERILVNLKGYNEREANSSVSVMKPTNNNFENNLNTKQPEDNSFDLNYDNVDNTFDKQPYNIKEQNKVKMNTSVSVVKSTNSCLENILESKNSGDNISGSNNDSVNLIVGKKFSNVKKQCDSETDKGVISDKNINESQLCEKEIEQKDITMPNIQTSRKQKKKPNDEIATLKRKLIQEIKEGSKSDLEKSIKLSKVSKEVSSVYNKADKRRRSAPKDCLDSSQIIDLPKTEESAKGLKCKKIQREANFSPEKEIKSGNTRREIKKNVVELKQNQKINDQETKTSIEDQKNIVCGVCSESVLKECWNSHISDKHCFIAWPAGQLLDISNELLLEQLKTRLKNGSNLRCSLCGLESRQAKRFLNHVKNCIIYNPVKPKDEIIKDDSTMDFSPNEKLRLRRKRKNEEDMIVTCGVCSKDVNKNEWFYHIESEHQYLAWTNEDTPVDVQNEEDVYNHLKKLSHQLKGLKCSICYKVLKSAKVFMTHRKRCSEKLELNKVNSESTTKDNINGSESDKNNINDNEQETTDGYNNNTCPVKCGVCKKEIQHKNWIEHICKEHEYLAWKEGQEALNIEDNNCVKKHLEGIVHQTGRLLCIKCGVYKKYVKSFLKHVGNCKTEQIEDKTVECAVCSLHLKLSDWKSHSIDKHYNLANYEGAPPINLRDCNEILIYMKEYIKVKKKFVCKTCGLNRASAIGFCAHIFTCGKSNEELQKVMETCTICYKPFLSIYKSPHYQYHKVQEMQREMKLNKSLEVNEDKSEDIPISDKRQAAVKAKKVIENYNSTVTKGKYQCTFCDFDTDDKSRYLKHKSKCEKHTVEVEENSSKESSCSSTDISDASSVEDDDQPKKSKSHDNKFGQICSRKLPFTISKPHAYVKKGFDDFFNENYTEQRLFSDWVACQYEIVPDDQLKKYLPQLKESCNVKINGCEWFQYKQFQGLVTTKKKSNYSLFVGGSVECMKWVPEIHNSIENDEVFLAVAAHRGSDKPHLLPSDTPSYASLIQIWSFGQFDESTPKLVLGLALDSGTVWDIEWCPSGARDEPSELRPRLGILAAACSNGSVYIFSVPHPSSMGLNDDKKICKLKPVAELSMTTGGDRQKFQATSLAWSKEKGHSIILVGYSNGNTAFYDLNTNSPLLQTTQKGVTIFYPYLEEFSQRTCITSVCMWECGSASCSASPSGLTARCGAARLRHSVAAAGVGAMPRWPALLPRLDAFSMMSDGEWWSAGRRRGAVACSACARCPTLAVFAPPALLLLPAHPALNREDARKRRIVALLDVKTLGKESKVVKDDLAIKCEPSTYAQAIKEYGIEIKTELKQDEFTLSPSSASPDPYPERFPLGEVTAAEYCPAHRHHRLLALATHAGLVVVVRTPSTSYTVRR